MSNIVLTFIAVFVSALGFSYPVRSNIGGRNISHIEESGNYPYDSEAEYLNSTGKEYIDLGLTFNHECAFEFECNAYSDSSSLDLMLVRFTNEFGESEGVMYDKVFLRTKELETSWSNRTWRGKKYL